MVGYYYLLQLIYYFNHSLASTSLLSTILAKPRHWLNPSLYALNASTRPAEPAEEHTKYPD